MSSRERERESRRIGSLVLGNWLMIKLRKRGAAALITPLGDQLLCQISADFNWDFKETATRMCLPSPTAYLSRSLGTVCEKPTRSTCASSARCRLLSHSAFHTRSALPPLLPFYGMFLSPLGSTEINSNLWRHNKFHGLALKIKRRLEKRVATDFTQIRRWVTRTTFCY